MKKEIKSKLEEYENLLVADGFDDAILGVALSGVNREPAVVYSVNKVLAILMTEGMDEMEAQEYFEFNILGAYVGENTPIFIDEI